MSKTNAGFTEFLKGKIGHLKFADLVYSEFEGLLLWVFSSIPGMIGFCLRNIVCKILFKKLDGFTWIQPRVIFVQTNRLRVGSFFAVNSGTYINAVGGIEIGNHVLIGSNVTISSGMHPIEGQSPPIFSRPTIPKKIIIEDDVWIGAGAVIMPGVTLKRGTVIGANSVVTKDTEPYSVFVGAPARKLRER